MAYFGVNLFQTFPMLTSSNCLASNVDDILSSPLIGANLVVGKDLVLLHVFGNFSLGIANKSCTDLYIREARPFEPQLLE